MRYRNSSAKDTTINPPFHLKPTHSQHFPAVPRFLLKSFPPHQEKKSEAQAYQPTWKTLGDGVCEKDEKGEKKRIPHSARVSASQRPPELFKKQVRASLSQSEYAELPTKERIQEKETQLSATGDHPHQHRQLHNK